LNLLLVFLLSGALEEFEDMLGPCSPTARRTKKKKRAVEVFEDANSDSDEIVAKKPCRNHAPAKSGFDLMKIEGKVKTKHVRNSIHSVSLSSCSHIINQKT
jgi:hypothetical protein